MSVIILSGVPASSSYFSSLTSGSLTLTLPDATYGPLSTSQITGLDSTLLSLQTNVADLSNDLVTGSAITAGGTPPSGAKWGIDSVTKDIFYVSGGVWAPVGPTPANAISPAATDGTGAIGVLTNEFALEDHKHPAQGVSADALNRITIGTDGLHYYTASNRTFAVASDVVTANTTLATAGDPTVAEMQIYVAANPTILDTILYYTGDNTSTSTPTHVFHVDQAGVVTLLLSPASSTSPTPANAISPAATDATGAIGVLTTEFALEDHKHPAQGVSADALNSLSIGTDGLHYFKDRKNNTTATVAPSVTDDTSSNYEVGSQWIDVANDVVYIAVDVTAGAAVWLQVNNAALTPANAISPAATDGTGAIGVLTTEFALEDHKHPAQGVSADAVGTNLLTVGGTDGLHLLDTSTFMANAISPAATDATGAIGIVDQAAREDHKHPAQGISTDANNSLTIGSDGLHYAPAVAVSGSATTAPTNAIGAGGSATTWARSDHKHAEAGVSADANNSLTIGSDGLHYAAPIIDEVVENAGALSGAAPSGAQWGIDTSTGDGYYVNGGNWTLSPSGAASTIVNTPAGNIIATDVQAAINELDAEKLALTGGIMSGAIDMGSNTITNVSAPFDVGNVHMFSATEYQSGNGGNGFFISTAAAPVATTPTYSFVNAPTTGMWWNAGDIAFSISGTDQFVVGAADIDVLNKRVVNVTDPVNPQDAVTLNHINNMTLNRVVGTATGIDLRALGTTNIYTVPVGKSLIITQIIIVAATNTPTGTPSDPTISFGVNGATTSIVNNATPTFGGAAGAADQAVYLTPDDTAATPASGGVVNMTVNIAAGHAALTGDVYIMGFEL